MNIRYPTLFLQPQRGTEWPRRISPSSLL